MIISPFALVQSPIFLIPRFRTTKAHQGHLEVWTLLSLRHEADSFQLLSRRGCFVAGEPRPVWWIHTRPHSKSLLYSCQRTCDAYLHPPTDRTQLLSRASICESRTISPLPPGRISQEDPVPAQAPPDRSRCRHSDIWQRIW